MIRKKENFLVHTTGNIENLKSILKSKSLRLAFSSENFSWKNRVVSKAAHPMVCFSEYNPETIDNEIITYGKYAVAFSKEWARTKNIGPVLYVSDTSIAAKGMNELLKARRKKTGNSKLQGKLRLAIMEVKCFMKNETGFNSKTKDKKFDFKSENEWRFVPQKSEIDNYLISQNQSTYINNKEKHNKKLEPFSLKFKFEDLVAIYVENESEQSLIAKMTGINERVIKISKWRMK